MEIKEYEKIIRPRLKDARFKHSKNVAKEAARLAKKYGADVRKAEIAGILHDITKETPEKEQLEIIKRAGIELTELEAGSPKLWHAISGSGYIKVEKVIFIADFTSEERDYSGVEKIRKAADKSLEAAMLEGLSFSIEDLAHRRLAISVDTLNAYNEVITQKRK